MSDLDISILIGHEGGHLLNKHISRLIRILGDETDLFLIKTKILIWNISADCCVNTQQNIPRSVKVKNENYNLCFPDSYDLLPNKIGEYYFHELMSRRNKNIFPFNHDQKDGKSKKGNGWENKASNGSHVNWIKDIKNIENSHLLPRKMDHFISGIAKASLKNVRERGNIPNYISELVGNLLKPPKALYYDIINRLIVGSRITRSKISLSRVNRKKVYSFFFEEVSDGIPLLIPFPGKISDHSFNISIILDTSASMKREEILEGLSGSKNLLENDRYIKITVLENDTKIQKEYVIKRLNDIQFKIKGRGGTNLTPALKRCKELNTDVTICFTDGFCENVNMIPRIQIPKKIIWVIGKNGNFNMVDKTGVIIKI